MEKKRYTDNKHYQAGLGSIRMECKNQSGKVKTMDFKSYYKALSEIFNYLKITK